MILLMAGYLVVLNNEMKADQKGLKMASYYVVLVGVKSVDLLSLCMTELRAGHIQN